MKFYMLSFMISIPLGSSPTLLMALFVMCVACLAGTALMIFKKSRDKPAGYAVLASGDPKWKHAQWKQLDWTDFKGTQSLRYTNNADCWLVAINVFASSKYFTR